MSICRHHEVPSGRRHRIEISDVTQEVEVSAHSTDDRIHVDLDIGLGVVVEYFSCMITIFLGQEHSFFLTFTCFALAIDHTF